MIRTGFKSHRGMLKKSNEDACFVLQREQVYVVADGVGGSEGGQCASNTAVFRIAKYVRENPPFDLEEDEIKPYVIGLVEAANKAIIAKSLGEGYLEMCTTLVLCLIKGNRAYFVNAGDSRGYIIKRKSIERVTKDHSYVTILLDNGVITEEEAENHPRNNEITKALGVENIVNPDFYYRELEEGDLVLLCSDGLYKELSENEILELSQGKEDMHKLSKQLVTRANAKGGRDNISAICIKWEDESRHE